MFNQQNNRPQLDWKEVQKSQRGHAIGTVNSAERADGSKVYSWCIGKEGRGQREGRVLKFLDCTKQDFADAHDVLEDCEEWVENDRKSGDE